MTLLQRLDDCQRSRQACKHNGDDVKHFTPITITEVFVGEWSTLLMISKRIRGSRLIKNPVPSSDFFVRRVVDAARDTIGNVTSSSRWEQVLPRHVVHTTTILGTKSYDVRLQHLHGLWLVLDIVHRDSRRVRVILLL